MFSQLPFMLRFFERAQIVKTNSVFDAIHHNMLAVGILASSSRMTSIAFVSLQRGSGSSTLAAGVAASLVRNGYRRVLLLQVVPSEQSQPNKIPGSVEKMVTGFDKILVGDPYDEEASQVFQPWWENLRQSYDVVLVDAGCLEENAPYRFTAFVEQYVLVLDANQITREMLDYFRRDGKLAALPFKGFLINNKRFYVPESVYRWLA